MVLSMTLFAGWGICESIVRIPARWLSSEHLLAGGNFLLRPSRPSRWLERNPFREKVLNSRCLPGSLPCNLESRSKDILEMVHGRWFMVQPLTINHSENPVCEQSKPQRCGDRRESKGLLDISVTSTRSAVFFLSERTLLWLHRLC